MFRPLPSLLLKRLFSCPSHTSDDYGTAQFGSPANQIKIDYIFSTLFILFLYITYCDTLYWELYIFFHTWFTFENPLESLLLESDILLGLYNPFKLDVLSFQFCVSRIFPIQHSIVALRMFSFTFAASTFRYDALVPLSFFRATPITAAALSSWVSLSISAGTGCSPCYILSSCLELYLYPWGIIPTIAWSYRFILEELLHPRYIWNHAFNSCHLWFFGSIFIFFFHGVQYTDTFTNNIQPPVWICMSGWTLYNASTHHFTSNILSSANGRGRYIVFLR